jgi:hypothetical protein
MAKLSSRFLRRLRAQLRSIERLLVNKGQPTDAESEFKTQAAEAGGLLAPILEKNIDDVIRSRVNRRATEASTKQSPEEYEKELRQKLELVKIYLYNDHLQKRYNLKKSSKAPSFTDIDWDIKTKHADAKLASLEPFPYATCRISFQKEFDSVPYNFFNAFGSVQINFSVDEIHYLQRVLSTIEERLKSVEKELSK